MPGADVPEARGCNHIDAPWPCMKCQIETKRQDAELMARLDRLKAKHHAVLEKLRTND